MNTDDESFLDGNAAAGALGDVFAVDITAAVGQCGNCGKKAPLADTRLYALTPGLVIRCTGCENALIRIVRTPTCAWLDLRGLTFLRVALPPS